MADLLIGYKRTWVPGRSWTLEVFGIDKPSDLGSRPVSQPPDREHNQSVIVFQIRETYRSNEVSCFESLGRLGYGSGTARVRHEPYPHQLCPSQIQILVFTSLQSIAKITNIYLTALSNNSYSFNVLSESKLNLQTSTILAFHSCKPSNPVSKMATTDTHPNWKSLDVAVSLRRAGHKFTIYERADFAGEVGASISCAANGTPWLREWGVDISKGKPVILEKLIAHEWSMVIGADMESDPQ